MSGHTPGPLKANHYGEVWGGEVLVAEAHGDTQEEVQANAAWLARTPELEAENERLQRIADAALKSEADALEQLAAMTAERDGARIRRLCKHHPGVDYRHAWGCPDCLKELRAENAKLADALDTACNLLECHAARHDDHGYPATCDNCGGEVLNQGDFGDPVNHTSCCDLPEVFAVRDEWKAKQERANLAGEEGVADD